RCCRSKLQDELSRHHQRYQRYLRCTRVHGDGRIRLCNRPRQPEERQQHQRYYRRAGAPAVTPVSSLPLLADYSEERLHSRAALAACCPLIRFNSRVFENNRYLLEGSRGGVHHCKKADDLKPHCERLVAEVTKCLGIRSKPSLIFIGRVRLNRRLSRAQTSAVFSFPFRLYDQLRAPSWEHRFCASVRWASPI